MRMVCVLFVGYATFRNSLACERLNCGALVERISFPLWETPQHRICYGYDYGYDYYEEEQLPVTYAVLLPDTEELDGAPSPSWSSILKPALPTGSLYWRGVCENSSYCDCSFGLLVDVRSSVALPWPVVELGRTVRKALLPVLELRAATPASARELTSSTTLEFIQLT